MPAQEKSTTGWREIRSGVKAVRKATAAVLGLGGKSKAPMQYAYGNTSITLPGDHALPEYQRQHRLYDRFLPLLVRHLDTGSVVVDVGANCGDTVAAMVAANPRLNYVCVEPDQGFFDLMTRNVEKIMGNDPAASIRCIQSLVGKAVGSAVLEGGAGTKHATLAEAPGALRSVTLDSLLAAPQRRVALIKSDVDGYDYDVLDSAETLIARDQPLLFFECQMDNLSQREAYEATTRGLIEKGYRDWWLFDNFGELVFRAHRFEEIKQLFDYVWRQNMGRSTRTIWYFDVLAAHERETNLAQAALDDYLTL